MTYEVECYAGSTYPEKPRAFYWEGRRYEVQAILDQRREPDGVGFLVRCSPEGNLFDLFYIISKDQWKIQSKGSTVNETAVQPKPNSQGD